MGCARERITYEEVRVPEIMSISRIAPCLLWRLTVNFCGGSTIPMLKGLSRMPDRRFREDSDVRPFLWTLRWLVLEGGTRMESQGGETVVESGFTAESQTLQLNLNAPSTVV